ncbi:MAG TPA: MATE family efflux transporter [Candidatus Eisenbacteria bacterium]
MTMARAANPILDSPHLSRVTLSLAWPIIVSRLLHTFFHLANVAWVGRLGPEAIGAVTTSIYLFWTWYALAGMITLGATSVVARHVGAGRPDEAARVAGQGVGAILVLACVMTALGFVGAGPLFGIISDDPDVRRIGADYVRIVSLASVPTYIILIGEAIYRGSGDTRTPMRVLVATLAVHVVLDPFLILGVGPFPRLGVHGAALATLITQSLGATIYLVLALCGRWPFSVAAMFKGFRADGQVIRAMAGIGAPISAIGLLFSSVYLVLAKIAAGYGTPILAALGIVNRLESFSFLTSEGFGVAATTTTGQNIGAGQLDRADRLARRARTWSTALTFVCGVIFLAVPEQILMLFTDDPSVIERGALFLRIVALAQPFQGMEIALEGALAGAGDTRPAMLIAVPLSLVRIPIILWLAGPMGMGAVAIWWTITVTSILRGLLVEAWFRSGRWRRRHEAPGAGQVTPGNPSPAVGEGR